MDFYVPSSADPAKRMGPVGHCFGVYEVKKQLANALKTSSLFKRLCLFVRISLEVFSL